MSNNKKEENEKIRNNLLTAFTKLNSGHTVSIGNEIIKKIISENEGVEGKVNYIISLISDYINSLKKTDKKEGIKVLGTICKSLKEQSPHLSRVLTILQSMIIEENSSIFIMISSTFAEIVESSIMFEDSSDNKENRTKYELLQGFCIYNMKQESKANQICGSLCLTSLIETCPMILQPGYMKYIWENIIHFIDKQNFNAKSELLNALISLIFASESLFRTFSTVTLYKILDYLTDSEWFRRKLALNVVYTLIIYCQEEIVPLKGHIIEFLRVLKSDKVKEVREVCMQTLKLFNEIECDQEKKAEVDVKSSREMSSNKKEKSFIKNISAIMNVNDLSSDSIPPEEKRNVTNKKKQRSKSPILKSPRPIVSKRQTNNVPIETKPKPSSKKTEIPSDKTKSKISTKTSIKENLNLSDSNNVNAKEDIKKQITRVNSNNINIKKIKKENCNINTTEREEDNHAHTNPNNISKRELKINRKEDNTFVNSKMIIKRDPDYSIFKTTPNTEFFDSNNEEIKIVVKEKKAEMVKPMVVEPQINYVKTNPQNIEEKTSLREVKAECKESSPTMPSIKPISPVNSLKNSKVIAPSTSISPVKTKIKNTKENSTSNSIENSDLIKQLKIMSEKQIQMVEAYEKLQEASRVQFDSMNDRIVKLENNVQYLSNYIRKLTNSSNGESIINKNDYQTHQGVNIVSVDNLEINENTFDNNNINYNKEEIEPNSNSNSNPNSNKLEPSSRYKKLFDNYVNNNKTVWPEILQELKNKNPNSAFKMAFETDELNFDRLIDRISFAQIKELDQSTVEEIVKRLIKYISNGTQMTSAITFLKNLLINLNYSIGSDSLQNIYHSLLYASTNKSTFNLTNEEMIDINLLISFINSKNENSYSNIVNSFANM